MGIVSTHWRCVTAPEGDQLAKLDLAISRVAADIAREQHAIKVTSVARDLAARFGDRAAHAAANRARIHFDHGAAAFWSEVERVLAVSSKPDP
jgi:hypothetical protein